MQRVETIVFNGIKYRRYPDSDLQASRRYYTAGIADRKRGYSYLHRDIWAYHHGPIPEGHHIHHVDHDPLNNDISNLECIPAAEHFRHHADQPRSEAQIAHHERNLPNFIEKAREWHKSPEGHAHHVENGKRVWELAEYRESECDQCGGTYTTRQLQRTDRFCSNACKSAWRRDSGIDDVDRDCAACGDTFRVNKYSKTKTCSRVCGGIIRRKRRDSLQLAS